MKDLGQVLSLAEESTLIGDSRKRKCSFKAEVRMNISHVLKRAQSLPFVGGECLSVHVLSSLLLLVENVLQKLVGVVVNRDGKRGKKGS